MTITVETITREQRSILLYAESCAVDHGGLLEGIRMNTADLDALKELAGAGIVTYGRIPGILLGTFARSVSYWCDLSDAAWELAYQLRRARAAKPDPQRQVVDAVLAEREAA